MSEYMELLEQTDQNIAAVLRTLERQGLADSTVVIFTTDHGIAFPGMKCTLKDTGIGVSLILRAPGITKAGTVTDSLVSHIDIFPTLCDLAGLEKPDRLEGTSLMPILSGNREKVREEIFSEVTFHAAYEPKRCIRTKRYKLIEYFDSYEKVIGPNTDDGYSKRTLMEYGYLDRKRNGRFALYDLIFDPGETDNLAAESEYKGLQDELSRRLHDWMERTNDPLLKGPVPKPDGAVINKKSSIHPSDNTYE
jgi:arylsulfatase A-like enzyme